MPRAHFVPMMVTLAIVGIVYGALCAMAQQDWKRLVAYSSVSHMAMVMLGMFALNPVGIMGSIVQQLNHGISTGALFLLVGQRLRAPAYATDFGVRRSVEGDAGRTRRCS